jgi:O-acetylserine/cysteine efflux transporter
MKLTHILFALVVVTAWGGNFVAMRFGAQEIPPYFLLGLRLVVASAALAWFAKSPRGMLIPLFSIGTTLCVLHFGLGLYGVRYIEAGTGAIAMQTVVPFAALLAWILYGETFGWRRTAGLLLAIAGLAIIAGIPRIGERLDMLLLMVVAAFFFAVATIQIKKLGSTDFMSINAWISILAIPQAFLVSWIFEEGQIEALTAAPIGAFASILYMGLIASIVGQGLWYFLVQRNPTNQVMPFTLLVPVLGVLFGVLLLDEPLSWTFVLGGLITLAGVAIIILRRPDLIAAEAAASKTS